MPSPTSPLKPPTGGQVWAEVAKKRTAFKGTPGSSSVLLPSSSVTSYVNGVVQKVDSSDSQTVKVHARDIICRQEESLNSSEAVGSDHETVMNALCLDASMLLHSSDAMATALSPCQLDAIEQILLEQLRALQQARFIQEHRKVDLLGVANQQKTQQHHNSGFLC
jgi:hypothetical protein